MTGPRQPYPYRPYPPPRPPRGGLPAWAVVLLVLGGCFALLVGLVTCAAVVASTDSTPDAATTAVPGVTVTADAPPGSAPAPTQTPAAGPTGLFQHPEDVVLESCAPGSLGWGDATVRVTNNSSEASTYSIQVAFESPDRTVLHATGYALVPRLEPGQTTVTDANTATEVPADVVCRVVQASRYRD